MNSVFEFLEVELPKNNINYLITEASIFILINVGMNKINDLVITNEPLRKIFIIVGVVFVIVKIINEVLTLLEVKVVHNFDFVKKIENN